VAHADGFVAAAADVAVLGLAVDDFAGAVAAAAGRSNVFGALARRVPIRSGRLDDSEARTPLSSFFGFAFAFFALSALSAIPLRVYGSRSGRGARPPSSRHKNTFRRAVLLQWAAHACSHD
jgi:hypothetical protein